MKKENLVNNRTENLITIEVRPEFELEEFMNFSHESRIDSEAMEALGNYWDKWQTSLAGYQIKGPKKSWVAVWLPENVEQEIDQAWAESPSRGYFLNCLAQYLCMASIEALLPQTVAGGCAPAPRPDKHLRQGLVALGAADEEGKISRRYAVVTYYPFAGGCEACALSDSCPKDAGPSFASVVLPGHTPGE